MNHSKMHVNILLGEHEKNHDCFQKRLALDSAIVYNLLVRHSWL